MEKVISEQSSLDEKLKSLAASTDRFEGYANPHAVRIARLADFAALKFNLSAHDRFSLRCAALVHDIGAAAMKRDYINANRRLTDDETTDVRRHTVIGEQEAARHGLSRAVQLLVRWHHEWWNGTGYPDALGREQIPLAARILRVADTYCALTDARPHRRAVSETEAKRHLTEWAGIEFDPKIVKAFLSVENSEELKSFSGEIRTGDE